MAKRPKRTKANEAFEAALSDIRPDQKQVIELMRLGLYCPPKHTRLHYGKCGAHARSTGRPCIAKALPSGRCRNHGGLSTGPRTAAGIKRCGDASRKWWKQWRLERQRQAASPKQPRHP
jgi:hypothetical protein